MGFAGRKGAEKIHPQTGEGVFIMGIMAFFHWLTLRDYDQAKAEGQRRTVGRFSRGNVLTQNGRYLNDDDVECIVRKGDRDMAQLERASASR